MAPDNPANVSSTAADIAKAKVTLLTVNLPIKLTARSN
jgi:hypothetical protein